MAQRMLYESGQDGRSVLGMLAVQVERDPKTGATVIRSVAPVSTPSGAAMENAVFDDGRMSVHAVGGSGEQPSAEELGQILSVVDGMGMKVLLDEVTVTPQRGETIRGTHERTEERVSSRFTEERTEERFSSCLTHTVLSRVDAAASSGVSVRSGCRGLGSDQGIQGRAESRGEDVDREEGDNSVVVVREFGRRVEDGGVEYRMEEGPVTLTFLGYADATAAGQGQGQAVSVGRVHQGGMLTVERVIITDEGEEVELELTAPPGRGRGDGVGLEPSGGGFEEIADGGDEGGDEDGDGDGSETMTAGVGGEVGKGESQKRVSQDICLDENGPGANAQGERGDNGAASPPSRAEGEIAPKRKTCQCCSAM